MDNKVTLAFVLALFTLSSPVMAQDESKTRVHSYFVDELEADGFAELPTPVIERRRNDRIFDGCSETNARIAPALVPIAMFFANTLLGEVDRALSRREEARLKARSSNFVGTDTSTDFIFGDRVSRCFVVDRFQSGFGETDDGARRRVYTDQSMYVIVFEKVGETAFRITDVRARIDNTPAWQTIRATSGYRANALVGVGIRAVSSPNGVPTLVELPDYSYNIKGLEQGEERGAASETVGSSVMPLPVGKSVPTTVVVSITESDVSLDGLRQQTELTRQMRSALFSAIGSSLETVISD